MDAIPVTQGDEEEPAGEVKGHRLDNEGLRTSLAKVRAAQEAALAHNRYETLKARLAVVTFLVTIAAGWVVIRASAARTRGAPSVAQAGAAPGEQTPVAPIAATAPAAPEPSASTAAAELPAADASTNAGVAAECAALSKLHRWREAAEPCALAVQIRPNDATLALALAQAEHARNRLPEAGEWARRAIALDSNLPEAFIILAHAEARAGDSPAAVQAYRRYLALAPRGWHARQARRAVRAAAR